VGEVAGRRRRLRVAAVAAVGALVLAAGCSGAGKPVAAKSAGLTDSAAAQADCRQLPSDACFSPQQLRVAYGIQPLLDRGIDGRGQTVVLMEFASQPQQSGPQQSGPSARPAPVSTAGPVPGPAPGPASGPSAGPASGPVSGPASGPASGPQQPVAQPPRVTNIRLDLALFDAVFGLPAAQLEVDTSLAGSDWPWLANGEEVEDAEIVHAVAPDAAIRVILIPPWSSPGSWIAAVDGVLRLALSQGSVVSLSAILGEDCFTSAQVAGLNAALQADQEHHVTVVAGSGDFGAATTACAGPGVPTSVKEVGLPASDPLVLAAGGTTLDANRATGAYIGETVWHTPAGIEIPQTSGGGFSDLFARPAYQDGVPGIGAARGLPDVAADAAARTGLTLAISDGPSTHIFFAGGGTSAATPLWGALIALADQYAGRHLGFVNPAIYRVGRSAAYHQAFHDITTGNSTETFPQQTITGYQARPGWDPATGWGSPNAQVLIPLLARYTSP
jgi:subtilase family serine protease